MLFNLNKSEVLSDFLPTQTLIESETVAWNLLKGFILLLSFPVLPVSIHMDSFLFLSIVPDRSLDPGLPFPLHKYRKSGAEMESDLANVD